MTPAALHASDETSMVELSERLLREYAELPAGAVLRSLARARLRARAWGCPQEHLVPTVEATTRWRLAQRLAGAPVEPPPATGPDTE